MNNHIMIDLETLSTRKNAVIVSIGAVKIENNVITETFKVNIDPVSSKSFGLHISKDTVDWWSQQSKEARLAWQTDAIGLKEALQKFTEWYGPNKKKYFVWGYGANFDITLMESSYQAIGEKEPWVYTNIMCLRTISNLTNKPIPRIEGTHHDALVDALNQSKYLIEFMK